MKPILTPEQAAALVAVGDLLVGEDPLCEPGLPLQDALHPSDLDDVHADAEHVHGHRLASPLAPVRVLPEQCPIIGRTG